MSFRPRSRRALNVAIAVISMLGLAILAACGAAGSAGSNTPATPAPANVTLLTTDGMPGTYLTDGAGRALYMWNADRGGASTCYDACAVDWPPIVVADTDPGSVIVGANVNKDLVGYTSRNDGSVQVTYGGWPLYYFKPDIAPGELAGQGDTGYGAAWWVVAPDGNPLPSG